MSAHVSAKFGTARRWATAWESTTCVILKSATSVSTATGSMHRIPVGTMCSCIAPSPEAIPPVRWRYSGPCRPRLVPRHTPNRHLVNTREIPLADLLNAVLNAHGGLDNWREFSPVQATIVTGGDLWAIKGQPQDPLPRRMTVASDREGASLRPFGADDQKTEVNP